MNVIITGASNGIGYETVLLFAKMKNINIIAISRNTQKLKQLTRQCLEINATCKILPLTMDLENFIAEDFLKELKKIQFNSVDILINNAGKLINKPFEKLTFENWMSVYSVNLFSVAKIIKTLLPLMVKASKCHIVNIGSYGGFQGSSKFPGLAAYSSSKAALANLTECLAEEFKNKNISVNCLALGAVQTEMLQQAFPGFKAPLVPKQMAQFIYDFATTGHNYFNGKILPVTLSTV